MICAGLLHWLAVHAFRNGTCCEEKNGWRCTLTAGHLGQHWNPNGHEYREDPDYRGSCWYCGKERARCLQGKSSTGA